MCKIDVPYDCSLFGDIAVENNGRHKAGQDHREIKYRY